MGLLLTKIHEIILLNPGEESMRSLRVHNKNILGTVSHSENINSDIVLLKKPFAITLESFGPNRTFPKTSEDVFPFSLAS